MMSRSHHSTNNPIVPNPVKREAHSRQDSKRLRTNDSHEHLDEFISNQIGANQGRSTRSQASRRNNQLIEAAAKAKNSNDFMRLAKISGYQSNPLAATLE